MTGQDLDWEDKYLVFAETIANLSDPERSERQ